MGDLRDQNGSRGSAIASNSGAAGSRPAIVAVTLYDPRWGTPPTRPGLLFNRARYVYEVAARPGQRSQALEALAQMARSNAYLQPYLDESASPPVWRARYVRVPTPLPRVGLPYAVLAEEGVRGPVGPPPQGRSTTPPPAIARSPSPDTRGSRNLTTLTDADLFGTMPIKPVGTEVKPKKDLPQVPFWSVVTKKYVEEEYAKIGLPPPVVPEVTFFGFGLKSKAVDWWRKPGWKFSGGRSYDPDEDFVPDAMGLPEPAARAVLSTWPVRFTGVRGPIMVVVGQKPPAGSRTRRGTTIVVRMGVPSGALPRQVATPKKGTLVTVPLVVGMTPQEAASALSSTFKVWILGDQGPGSTVVSQEPAAGKKYPAFSTVTVKVKRPHAPVPEKYADYPGKPEMVNVPAVAEMWLPFAKRELTLAGFRSRVDGPSGTYAVVRKVDPPGKAPRGSVIALTTFDDPPPVRPLEGAKGDPREGWSAFLLRRQEWQRRHPSDWLPAPAVPPPPQWQKRPPPVVPGLTPAPGPEDEVAPGRVGGQPPAPVAAPPKPSVRVPSVVNLEVRDALALLARFRLTGVVVDSAGNRVKTQSAPEGRMVPEGSAVYLTTRPAGGTVTPPTTLAPTPKIRVPDLMGRPRWEVEQLLAQAGLWWIWDSRSTSMTEEAVVAAQSPGAGEPAEPKQQVIVLLEAPSRVLPTVVGKERSLAVARLRGFDVRVVPEVLAAVPDVLVAAQAPQGGTAVRLGQTVLLTLARGVRVPNVVGMFGDVARETLAGFGLEPIGETLDFRKVDAQEPVAGALVLVGSVVRLTQEVKTIAVGRVVPNVITMTPTQAKEALQKESFEGDVINPWAERPEVVVEQRPKPGSLRPPGTTVELLLGPREAAKFWVDVPDVVGDTVEDAKRRLTLYHLKHTVIGLDKPYAVVTSQDPRGGARVDPDSGSVVLTASLKGAAAERQGEEEIAKLRQSGEYSGYMAQLAKMLLDLRDQLGRQALKLRQRRDAYEAAIKKEAEAWNQALDAVRLLHAHDDSSEEVTEEQAMALAGDVFLRQMHMDAASAARSEAEAAYKAALAEYERIDGLILIRAHQLDREIKYSKMSAAELFGRGVADAVLSVLEAWVYTATAGFWLTALALGEPASLPIPRLLPDGSAANAGTAILILASAAGGFHRLASRTPKPLKVRGAIERFKEEARKRLEELQRLHGKISKKDIAALENEFRTGRLGPKGPSETVTVGPKTAQPPPPPPPTTLPGKGSLPKKPGIPEPTHTGGRPVQTGGRTTDLAHNDWAGAEREYRAIRAADDAGTIARNTGWKQKDVAKVKDHVFFRDHILDERVGRFDADPQIANAWNRLQRGTHTASDLSLLEHELFEARFEAIFGVNYRTAHDAALRSGRPGLK